MSQGGERRKPGLVLALLCGVFVASGANCVESVRTFTAAPFTPALAETATLYEVIAKVNQNNSQIHSISTTNATIGGRSGEWPFPTLQANLAAERPRRLRLIGEAGLLGSREVDLGSNDELFWFWVRRNQPPAVYFSRHDEFANSDARRAFPIDPQWVIESLGMATLDPDGQHQGPQSVGKGRVEIRTLVPTASGNMQRVTRVDLQRGWIVEQHLYDQGGTLVASALARDHRADPGTGLIVPRHLEIQWPAAQLTLKIGLGDVTLNQSAANPGELFAMPEVPGAAPVNLSRMAPQTGPAAAATSSSIRYSPHGPAFVTDQPTTGGSTYSTAPPPHSTVRSREPQSRW